MRRGGDEYRPPFTTSTALVERRGRTRDQTISARTTPGGLRERAASAPGRKNEATSVNHSASVQQQLHFGAALAQQQQQLYRQPQQQHTPFTGRELTPMSTSHQQGGFTLSPALTQGSAAGSGRIVVSSAQVTNMLETIVALSQSIASQLSTVPGTAAASQPPQLQAGCSANSDGAASALKAQEIERIVRRVESHYQARTDEARRLLDQQTELLRQVQASKDGEIASLRAKISDLEQLLATRSQYPEFCLPVEDGGASRPAAASRNVLGDASSPDGHNLSPMTAVARQRLQQQRAALSELEQQWGFISPTTLEGAPTAPVPTAVTSARTNDTNHLRLMLVSEKRQRLLVEEQTQDLAEQHAKVIQTLEQRLRKQEKQIADLTGALGANDVIDGGGKGGGTPRSRHLLRTQSRRSGILDDSGVHGSPSIGTSNAPPPPSAEAPAPRPSGSIGPEVVEVSEVQFRGVNTTADDTKPRGPSGVQPLQLRSTLEDSSSKQARLAADDVASFLESISRELESISEGETKRSTMLSAI